MSLKKKYHIKDKVYPVIFVKNENSLDVCLDASVINECDDMDKLKDKIKSGCLT